MQVAAGSGPVELASGRQVALLACLLIAGDKVVSRDRLIDALWGDTPPATATNALQVQVHALRKRLGAERIAREGVGYRLCREPGELDLERFETLVARARTEEPEAAATTLREALALWRGPAYEDVRYDAFAQAEVARLEELRLAAVEDRVEAELALGRHRDLVSELESLVAAHHGRERLCGQLMLALYRSDRQTAALKCSSRRAGRCATSVAVRGDTLVEPDEALSVSLSEPDNATLGDASAAFDDHRRRAAGRVRDQPVRPRGRQRRRSDDGRHPRVRPEHRRRRRSAARRAVVVRSRARVHADVHGPRRGRQHADVRGDGERARRLHGGARPARPPARSGRRAARTRRA